MSSLCGGVRVYSTFKFTELNLELEYMSGCEPTKGLDVFETNNVTTNID